MLWTEQMTSRPEEATRKWIEITVKINSEPGANLDHPETQDITPDKRRNRANKFQLLLQTWSALMVMCHEEVMGGNAACLTDRQHETTFKCTMSRNRRM
eukprot:scaffold205600_cov15-Prasinocladus_malaysianus.AAC.1